MTDEMSTWPSPESTSTGLWQMMPMDTEPFTRYVDQLRADLRTSMGRVEDGVTAWRAALDRARSRGRMTVSPEAADMMRGRARRKDGPCTGLGCRYQDEGFPRCPFGACVEAGKGKSDQAKGARMDLDGGERPARGAPIGIAARTMEAGQSYNFTVGGTLSEHAVLVGPDAILAGMEHYTTDIQRASQAMSDLAEIVRVYHGESGSSATALGGAGGSCSHPNEVTATGGAGGSSSVHCEGGVITARGGGGEYAPEPHIGYIDARTGPFSYQDYMDEMYATAQAEHLAAADIPDERTR